MNDVGRSEVHRKTTEMEHERWGWERDDGGCDGDSEWGTRVAMAGLRRAAAGPG